MMMKNAEMSGSARNDLSASHQSCDCPRAGTWLP
jgi:hypothetical protein